jgi:hypothetical protein
MNYNLKDKIVVTDDFLNDLITKSWQESEAIQQQVANIDTSTRLGAEVARLLKNTCTNYYILIGCLENLAENSDKNYLDTAEQNMSELPQRADKPKACDVAQESEQESEDFLVTPEAYDQNNNFEPFEYFVDFDEPSGDPLSDKDLYGN